MDGYRAFVIGEDGHICDKREFEAANDEAAVQVARRLRNRHSIEIWQLDRKVAILDADTGQSAEKQISSRGRTLMRRCRFKQDRTLGERLIKEAKLAREKVGQLPLGEEREDLLKEGDANIAANIDEWLNSLGLQPPKKDG